MSDLDDIFEQYRDADALRNVPFRPDQFSQLQTDLDGEQYGMVGQIAVPVGREPSPAPASAEIPSRLNPPDVTSALNSIYSEYPALKDWGVDVIDSRGEAGKDGYLEFYHPDESRSPNPGKPTVELFSPELQGNFLSSAIFGDMLHYAPDVNPEFARLREGFRSTLTPEQKAIDRRAYERARQEYGEDRPFDDWFDISRLDAYIRGYLAPDPNNEWADAYTPEQRELLERMRTSLRNPAQPRYVGRGGQVYDEPPPGVGIEIGTSETPVQATEGSTGEDIARGAVRGASRASQAIVETAPMLGAPVDLVNERLRAIGIPVSDEPFMGSESIKKGISNFMDWADRTFVPQAADDAFRRFVEEDPTSPLAQSIVEELTRFGAQAVTPGAALRAFKVGAPVVRGMAWGAIADFINAEPDEKLIVQEIAGALSGASEDERGAVASAIMDVLSVNETDPQAIRKAKFALEGMVIGAAFEGAAQLLIRAAKAVPWQEIMGSLADAGRAADERIAELSRGGTMMANPIGPAGDILVSAAGKLARTVSPNLRAFSREENAALREAASDAAQAKAIKQRAAEIKANYPTDEGWLPIEATGARVDKKGNVEVTWRQPAYGFDKPPAGITPEQHLENISDVMVQNVGDIVQRAANGDTAATEIIRQARWYRDMRSRLRAEFGGLGDVFADLLGATSARTVVEQNWRNSIEILRRYSRGEYDKEIKMYLDRLATGERMDPTFLHQLYKEGKFELIKSAAGKLFNTNSPAATGALLDMFRQVKAGSAPKTINFTGNLIGYSNDATIDVWAARWLRDAAGLPRIPPPAEKAVGGNHLKGSTLEDPIISGEFAFGQKVFAAAADEINRSGLVKNFDQSLGDLGADDLQALVWFIEKEKWTKAGWTSKAGEGGSLDFEAGLAGAADPQAVLEARRAATESFNPPARRKKDTDETYAARVKEAQVAFDQKRMQAEKSLQDMAAPLSRTLLGVSRERPGAVPTNVQQAELAAELTSPVQNDPSVIGFQANNTYGEFMSQLERALNAEFVTTSDFDDSALTRQLVESGKKYDQDAVFISKVLRAPTKQSRPGVEIYFSRREGVDMAQKITAMLREKGVDGFTFITDARQMDRVDVQAAGNEATAGLTGIRFQYIPEFDDTYDAARHAEIVAEKEDLFERILDDIYSVPGIAQADVVHYDTKVFRRATGTDWMTGGETYDDFLRAAAGSSNRPQGTRAADSRPSPPDSSP